MYLQVFIFMQDDISLVWNNVRFNTFGNVNLWTSEVWVSVTAQMSGCKTTCLSTMFFGGMKRKFEIQECWVKTGKGYYNQTIPVEATWLSG